MTTSEPHAYQPIIDRIVREISPLQIVLFGSKARGDDRVGSDVDLLVVMPSGTHRRRTARRVYRSLIGIETPVDLVVVTQEDVEMYADHPGLIIRLALAEGRTLYAA